MSKLVTVKTFQTSTDAHLAKTLLEAEGLEAFVFGENTMSINPFFTFYPGMGVHLKVHEADLEKAKTLLVEPSVDLKEAEIGYTQCPKCNSTEISRFGKDWRSYLAWGYIFVPFALLAGITKKRKRCSSCGHIWKS